MLSQWVLTYDTKRREEGIPVIASISPSYQWIEGRDHFDIDNKKENFKLIF
jgi:hypothetical protein